MIGLHFGGVAATRQIRAWSERTRPTVPTLGRFSGRLKHEGILSATLGLAQRLTDAQLEAGPYTRVAIDCICIAPPLVSDDTVVDRIVETLRTTIPRVVTEVRAMA